MQQNPDRIRRLSLLVGVALIGGAFYLASCHVDVPDNITYRCTTTQDCGGDGYVCATPGAGQAGYCCKPTNGGVEICDGIDNDCNGVVDDLPPDPCFDSVTGKPDAGRCRAGTRQCADGGVACVGEVLPTAEVCNGIDDDCDGVVDNGFNLQGDTFNCGACNNVCPTNQYCDAGNCATPPPNCLISCTDPACNNQSCGTGCLCVGGLRKEIICSDGLDNDHNGATDCADPACDGGACSASCDGGSCPPTPGCTCISGAKVETICYDGIDNNGNGAIDCADPTCNGSACSASCDGGACSATPGCTCVGGAKAETICYDGIDNNGNGATDCADPTCDGGACQSDGGVGCLCLSGAKVERNCVDGIDNDNNGLTDCADPACNNVLCGTGCLCAGGVKTETICNDGKDNDGDGKKDCLDSDCLGKSCAAGGKICRADGGCQ